MKTPTPQNGFTLIELLTVIAIIGILAAIIIPTVGRVRESARDSVCKSNLRQIGLAIQIYANETGFFPPAIQGPNDENPGRLWRQSLRSYMGSQAGNPNQEHLNSQLVICPSRTIEPADTLTNVRPTYSAHFLVMPNRSENSSRPKIRLGGVTRPSEIILLADSTQQAEGGSHAVFHSVSEMLGPGSEANGANPLPTANDSDPQGGAWFRYRHGDRLNAVFVDGHVGSFRKGEVLQRHVRINY